MLFHSLKSSDLPSYWGLKLTSQKLAFGMQALPTLAFVLAAIGLPHQRICHRVREAISLAYMVNMPLSQVFLDLYLRPVAGIEFEISLFCAYNKKNISV